MRFHSIAIIFAIATAPTSVQGFGIASRQLSFARSSSTTLQAKTPEYDFGGLEAKLFTPPTPAPAPVVEAKKSTAKPAVSSTPEPKAVQEKTEEKQPAKAKKTKDPKPAPVVEKPKPAPAVEAPKPAPVVEAVAPPKPAPVVEKPSKPAAKTATKDSNAVPAGVALGAAPLVVAPFVALSAVRSTLAKTKARRDEIAKEIAEFEAAEAARLAKKNAEVDGGTLGKAVGALGGAAVALGLIITSPFGNMNAPGALKTETVAPKAKVEKVVKKETSSKTVQSAPESAISKPKVTKNAIGSKKSSSKVDGYDLSIDPAVLEAAPAPKAAAPTPAPKPVVEKKVVAEDKAAAAAAEKKAAEEAKAAAEKKEAEAKAAAAAEKKAAEEAKAAAEKKAAEEAKAAADKKEAEAKAAAAAEKKAAEESKAAAEKKAAEEAKAAAEKKAAEEAKAAAEKKAAEEAKAAAAAAEKKAAEEKAATVKSESTADAAVGVVRGGEAGGRVLPREEVSAETLDFLKKYKQ